MSSVLPVVSFLCAVLLACIVPAHWSKWSIAMLMLIAWLFVCNIIQGVNAAVWAMNVEVAVPVWCDIATKLLLGASLALPASCLNVIVHLRRCLSGYNPSFNRGVPSFDLLLSNIFPVIYMALHIIVQNHRFDLTIGMGCTASVFVSVPAICLVWLPPLVLCIITLVLATHTVYQQLSSYSDAVMWRSNRLISFGNLRLLLTATLITSLVLVSTAFKMHAGLASTDALPWTSWHAVHAQLSSVDFTSYTSQVEIVSLRLSWWIIPACSLVVIVLSLSGIVCNARDDALTGYQKIISVFRQFILRDMDDLHPHISRNSSDTLSTFHPIPAKPGWWSSLHPNSKAKARTTPITITIPKDMPASPSTSSASEEAEAKFAQATIKYLESPTGRAALGLPPLSVTERGRHASEVNLPGLPVGIDHGEVTPGGPINHNNLRHSILAEPWPRPPSVIPVSPVTPIAIHPPSPGPTISHSRAPSTCSFSTSLVSSTISASPYASDAGYPLKDSPTLPHFAPFADAGIPAEQGHLRGASLAVPKHSRRIRSKDKLIARNLSLNLNSKVRGKTREENDEMNAIYMSIVKETV